MAVEISSRSALASLRTSRTQALRTVRVSVRTRARRNAGVTTALSTGAPGASTRGARLTHSVRCHAEKEKNDTLSNLDSLLGVQPEPPKPVREVKKVVTPEVLPPPTPMADTPPTQQTEEPGNVDFSEKAIASLCYMLPLLDGLKYSKFLLTAYPQFALLLLPIAPAAQFYYSLGFFNIILFFGMYLGVAQNRQLSKFMRYNAMQAIVLDILLILPDVLLSLFNGINGPPTSGAGLELKILLNNTVFLFVYLSVAYGSISALTGKSAKLPLVGEAADMQTGGGMDDEQ